MTVTSLNKIQFTLNLCNCSLLNPSFIVIFSPKTVLLEAILKQPRLENCVLIWFFSLISIHAIVVSFAFDLCFQFGMHVPAFSNFYIAGFVGAEESVN